MSERTPKIKPVEDAPAPIKAEPLRPRFDWQATSADGKAAEHGRWRVRVQWLGGSGLWRPFVEYVGEDYRTAEQAERALARLLK